VLWFWVVVLVVLIGAVAIVAAGRGDSMVEVYDDRPDASLPAGRPLNADDLLSLRLNTGVRGYRMDEVDALLARLEAEMLERDDCAAQASPRPVPPEPVPPEPVPSGTVPAEAVASEPASRETAADEETGSQ
jgi:DivIVA domain-containing protein